VINHCDRCITLLSDTDTSFGLFNPFTYSDMGKNLPSAPESVTSAIKKIKGQTFIKLQPEKLANSM
jgi:hypothetical protein